MATTAVTDQWLADPTAAERRSKYYVDDVEVTVATERVQYLDADGKLITESLKDYTRKTVRKQYASLECVPHRLERCRAQAGHH